MVIYLLNYIKTNHNVESYFIHPQASKAFKYINNDKEINSLKDAEKLYKQINNIRELIDLCVIF